jgi:CheY-like chemotaxis protein
MREGGRLHIFTEARQVTGDAELEDGDYVVIGVSDTGAGMSPEVAERVFEPFFTTKEAGSGTGLGLSMVHGLAVQSGGKVELDSEPGEGTTVRLILHHAEADLSPLQAAAASEGPADLAGLRLLVIDDDDHVRAGLVEALRTLGADVASAPDPQQGLERLAEQLPDLVMLDFAMPMMDGAALAGQIRARWPDLPLIFGTGYGDVDAIEASVSPAPIILRKPFTLEELSNAVATALQTADASTV